MGKILIVDDHATFRQSLKEILSNAFPSISIEEAADGKEALKKIEDSHPDLIFMDIKLPDENGLHLTQKIKDTNPDMTVVVVTSYNIPEYRDAAQRYRANHFLSKTSSHREEIVELVKDLLPLIDDR
jgi:DNA-binding NarL/FixJ family response regulator